MSNHSLQSPMECPGVSRATARELGGDELLMRSSLYREYLAEREEILKHKWLESEKAGRDIGFEQAIVSWVIWHRNNWQKERQSRRNGIHGA